MNKKSKRDPRKKNRYLSKGRVGASPGGDILQKSEYKKIKRGGKKAEEAEKKGRHYHWRRRNEGARMKKNLLHWLFGGGVHCKKGGCWLVGQGGHGDFGIITEGSASPHRGRFATGYILGWSGTRVPERT